MKHLLLCAVAACFGNAYAADASTPAPATDTSAATIGAPATDPANTKVNKRDRDDANPTADDQNLSEADRKLLQAIRRAVTKDDAISTNGHNVKILAKDGVVTLRGPVKDENEKSRIGDLATKTAGVTKVDNQLEIAAK